MSLFPLYVPPVVPGPHLLFLAMAVMLGALMLITVFILLYLLAKKKRDRQKEIWRRELGDTLQEIIFWEPEPGSSEKRIPLPPETTQSLRRTSYRQLLIDELTHAKKAFTGQAADNIVNLFNQLDLKSLSLRKLNSRKWHLKAKGIQELAMMEQKSEVARIYRLTNAAHDLVRMEAQSAIVQLYGFEGLRFLDIIDRPLSEWQQITLLRILSRTPGILPERIIGWLSSNNDTVRIFALKLAAEHHQQELHDKVIANLQHSNALVRLQAIRCLKEIFDDTTTKTLAATYQQQAYNEKQAILETVGHIGSDEDGDFLAQQLSNENNYIKLGAARALIKLGQTGQQLLAGFPNAHSYPWKEIIGQAKTEWTT